MSRLQTASMALLLAIEWGTLTVQAAPPAPMPLASPLPQQRIQTQASSQTLRSSSPSTGAPSSPALAAPRPAAASPGRPPVTRAKVPARATRASSLLGVQLLRFQLAAVGAFNAGSSSFTLEPSWDPLFPVGGKLALGAHLGALLLKKAATLGGGTFVALDAGGVISWLPGFLAFDAGGGIQNWIGNGGTHAMAMGTVGFRPPLSGAVDRIFVGYTALFGTTLIHEFKAGVALSFH